MFVKFIVYFNQDTVGKEMFLTYVVEKRMTHTDNANAGGLAREDV